MRGHDRCRVRAERSGFAQLARQCIEAVDWQRADAAAATQVFSYANWLGSQMNAGMTLPLIRTNLFGVVGNTSNRSRIDPAIVASNVSVSGATVNSLLNEVADPVIDTETDLVLSPSYQSQIEYVEAQAPQYVIGWVGNNDALSAALAFDQLNASQLTPLADFEDDYTLLVDRLGALISAHGTRVVLANVPDVVSIGFLLDAQGAAALTGFPVALPAGSYTSLPAALLMAFLGNDNLIDDPDYVLDPGELETIRGRIEQFNDVIAQQAARFSIPVVDVHGLFNTYLANPPTFFGIPLTNRVFGGLFSIDGVHPNNIAHALLANQFIATLNQAYGTTFPEISSQVLHFLFLTDPSIDKDKDGRVRGRLGVGLLETIAFLLGYSGDVNDLDPN
jgi:phospholipase/lecithinase/hemolysin